MDYSFQKRMMDFFGHKKCLDLTKPFGMLGSIERYQFLNTVQDILNAYKYTFGNFFFSEDKLWIQYLIVKRFTERIIDRGLRLSKGDKFNYHPESCHVKMIQYHTLRRFFTKHEFLKIVNRQDSKSAKYFLNCSNIYDMKSCDLELIGNNYIDEIKKLPEYIVGGFDLLMCIYAYCTQTYFVNLSDYDSLKQVFDIYNSRRFPLYNNLILLWIQDCDFNINYFVEHLIIYTLIKNTKNSEEIVKKVVLNIWTVLRLVSMLDRKDVVSLIIASF